VRLYPGMGVEWFPNRLIKCKAAGESNSVFTTYRCDHAALSELLGGPQIVEIRADVVAVAR
jgi:hypothetical protein